MTAPANHLHHSIDYIEFSAIDVQRAKTFYSEAFGWTFNDYGPEYAGIRHLSGEGEVGGICKSDEAGKGGSLVVLYSNHLESSLESVLKAGGVITKPIFTFPGGRRFHFSDPSRNELAVWSAV